MEIKKTEFKRSVLVEVKGRIDSSNAHELSAALHELTDNGRFNIIIDMRGVDFMSSRGYWTLIQTQKACKLNDRGEVVLVGLEQQLKDALNMIGLENYFKVFDEVTPAVGHF